MLALEARFALLVLFCSLSTQWLAPISGVSAAAISRQPASRRSSSNAARYYQGTSPHSQRVLPWSRHHGRGRGSHHKRMASNPFSKFAEEVLSGFKNKFHHKRSHKAIVIPSNHGDAYLVSHARRASTPLWGSTNQTSTSNDTSASTQSQDSSVGGIPGAIAIVSHDENSVSGGPNNVIAFLFADWENGGIVFGASQTNQTQLIMVPVPSNATTRELTIDSSQEDSPVKLAFYTDTPANTKYQCLTFNPSPGSNPEPMTGQPCGTPYSAADVDNTHSSQIFSYNKTSGVIRPMWFFGQDDGTTNTTTAQDISAAAAAASAGSTSSAAASATGGAAGAQATSTALGTRDDGTRTQNVTLVFVPNNRAAAADVSDSAEGQAQSSVSASAAVQSASASGVVSAAAVAPSSASASGVVSAAAVAPSSASASGVVSAAAVAPSSASPSASGVVSAAAVAPSSASASGAVSAAAVAPSSASGSFSSAPAPSQTAAGLSVELVGGGSVPQPAAPLSLSAPSAPSPATAQSSSAPAAAQSVNAAAVPPTQSSSSSSAPAPSLNAAAVSAAQSSSSSAPAQSVNAAAVPAAQSSSSAAAPSPSVNAAAVAASIASSASSASASAPASGSAAAASVDSSAPSASASATSSGTPSATFVAAVMQREAAPAMTPVSTDPYVWKFQADSR